MKGIKAFYQNNRVFVILMSIVLVCVVIMAICLVSYFYGSKDSSVYGERLDGIDSVKIEESRQSDIESKLNSDALIASSDIMVTGKIVYVKIEFENTASLVEAQSKALELLDEFSDEEKKFYDFHFTLEQEKSDASKGFIISGAKNVNGTNLVWNNNNEVAETEETSDSSDNKE